jgi:hypothetical protein
VAWPPVAVLAPVPIVSPPQEAVSAAPAASEKSSAAYRDLDRIISATSFTSGVGLFALY